MEPVATATASTASHQPPHQATNRHVGIHEPILFVRPATSATNKSQFCRAFAGQTTGYDLATSLRFEPDLATQNAYLQALQETGATGLEPATSGVTGLFHGSDGWRRLTRNRSIDAAPRPLASDLYTIA